MQIEVSSDVELCGCGRAARLWTVFGFWDPCTREECMERDCPRRDPNQIIYVLKWKSCPVCLETGFVNVELGEMGACYW